MSRRGAPAAIAGATLLLLLAALAAGAPVLAPQPPDDQDLAARLQGPGPGHPLGRDDLGRDVLSRILWGTRISLLTGLLVVVISGTIGVLLGALSGTLGGRADAVLTATIDLLLAFPGVLLAVALVAVLGPRLSNVVLALAAVGWVPYARQARAQARALRGAEFVEAVRGLGGSPARITARHVVPNLLPAIMVQAALGLGGTILAEAGLSFLGLGVPPPAPSWGSMLRAGSQNLLDAPHMAVAAGAAICAAVLGANLLADGIGRGLGMREGGGPERAGPAQPRV